MHKIERHQVLIIAHTFHDVDPDSTDLSCVHCHITAPPVWSGDQLVARRSSGPVRDNVTGTWHVTLECGHFLDRGQPPVNVEWVVSYFESCQHRDNYMYNPNILVSIQF